MTVEGGIRLTASTEPASLESVHALLERLWLEHGDVLPEDRTRFEIAVTEIAGNIIRHATDGEPISFELEVFAQPGRLQAEFRDGGKQVDVDLDSAELPVGLAESGRGLALALAAVHELNYRREGSMNHWRIVRWRTGS
ncbi:ATP-binding protein [Geodermatophilus sp. SYSU D00965]